MRCQQRLRFFISVAILLIIYRLWIVPNSLDASPFSRPFRSKEMWLSDKGCGHTIKAVWGDQIQCDPKIQVMRKVEKCGT